MNTVFDAAVGYEVFRREALKDCLVAKSVLVSGCFDCVHIGHLKLLKFAYDKTSSYALPYIMVGVNSDHAVRKLKGASRPIHREQDRCELMAGFREVSIAFVIYDVTITDTIRNLKPNYWVKGSDYTLETLNQDERTAADIAGTTILFAPKVEGVSSTNIIERMNR